MTRKLMFLIGTLLLALVAWTPSVEAIGPCSCTFCRLNSTANCLSAPGEVCLCEDYYIANC